MSLTLRPYQLESIQGVRDSFARGNKRVILVLPTGSGKTECAMMIIKCAIDKGKRAIFLCNRINLVSQTSARFTRAGIDHGIIQGGNTSRVDCKVIVASIQTVANRGMPECDLIIIDEAHGVAGAASYRKMLIETVGTHIAALTATPYSRGLGKHYDALGGPLFEDVVVAIKIRELIEQGYLVDCDIYAPSKPDLSKVKVVAGEYDQTQLGSAVDRPKLIGDIVTQWLKHANGAATVCFATNIAHSQHIVEEFVKRGVRAEHLDCYTKEDERKAILARVASGETTVISNVGILCEGWDFPACRVLILARPTKSLIRHIQMSGRVLRPFPGKDRALILDHSGSVELLGFPTDDFPIELDDGKPKTSTGGKDKPKDKPLPKPCPSCSYLKTVHVCPICGFAAKKPNTVKVAAGELKKLEKPTIYNKVAQPAKKPIEKKEKAKPLKERITKQDAYSQLMYIADDRGYKPGWAANKYREIFEVWPRGLKDSKVEPGNAILNFVKSKAIGYGKSIAKFKKPEVYRDQDSWSPPWESN